MTTTGYPTMSDSSRLCPLCDASASGMAFPFSVQFAGKRFDYFKCSRCASVFVNPVPNALTFAAMYAKAEYHDCHYVACDKVAYIKAAQLLRGLAPAGATVLDYGCGAGYFLQAVKKEGFLPCGVEFDADAAKLAAENVGCEVLTVEMFSAQAGGNNFDVIHLGDVLEHLPNPASILRGLLTRLKPGGILFIEGPLEINPSPVYWAANFFGTMKKYLRPGHVGQGQPTHLFRTGARQQLDFFTRVAVDYKLKHWVVYETGWPYNQGGLIKRVIMMFAIWLGGRSFRGHTFGNRFSAIYFSPDDSFVTTSVKNTPL